MNNFPLCKVQVQTETEIVKLQKATSYRGFEIFLHAVEIFCWSVPQKRTQLSVWDSYRSTKSLARCRNEQKQNKIDNMIA